MNCRRIQLGPNQFAIVCGSFPREPRPPAARPAASRRPSPTGGISEEQRIAIDKIALSRRVNPTAESVRLFGKLIRQLTNKEAGELITALQR